MANVRRGVLAIGVLLALVVGIMLWRSRGNEQPTTSAKVSEAAHTAQRPGTHSRAQRGATWFAQAGVAGRRVAGVVTTEDGAPVGGASVHLTSEASRAGLIASVHVVTDDAGRFDLGVQPATTYLVAAQAPKLTAALAVVDLRQHMAAPEQLHLIVLPCQASIHGTVRDSAGGVVPHATITRAEQRGIVAGGGVEADDAGAYELCLPHGGTLLVVQAEGYASLAEGVTAYGRTQHDFELAPGASIAGRVVRADDRSPVAGALVELRHEDRRRGMPLLATSDAEGRFVIDGVAPGRARVVASGDGMTTADDIEVLAEIGRPTEEIECALVAAYVVSGKVVERGTGAPLGGIRVTLVEASERPTRPLPSAVAQPDGSFTIERVLPGEYIIRDDDENPLRVNVVQTDVTGVVVELEARGSIAGRVLRDGKPVAGANVRAGEGAGFALSDHDGRYELRFLRPNTYRLYAQSDRLGAFTRGNTVTLGTGEHKTGVDVNLELSGSISGVVVDQTGAPVPGVFLKFSLLGGEDFGSATTDDDGTFSARALAGGGEYVYEIRQRPGAMLAFAPLTGKRFPPITVADGNTQVTGLRIQIRYERFTISGRVTSASGEPVPDVTINAWAQTGGRYRNPTTLSDQNGAFALRDLPAGTYGLYATSPRGMARVGDIAAGTRDVELQLAELGSIEGSLVGFSGQATVHVGGTSWQRARVSGASFKVRDLMPGDYLVTATTPTDAGTAKVKVTAGPPTQVTITKHPTGTITGTIVDENTRAPVANMRCSTWFRGEGNDTPPNVPSSGQSDKNGVVRLERVLAGTHTVSCYDEHALAEGEVTVVAGQAVSLTLTAKTFGSPSPPVRSGLTFEDQLDEIRVKAVAPDSPGARAGVAVGDIVKTLDDDDVQDLRARNVQAQLDVNRGEDSVKLGLERGDKRITVTLIFGDE